MFLSPVGDPYTVTIPGSGTILQFCDYHNLLPWQSVLRILNDASLSAFDYKADTLIGVQPLKYEISGLQLMLIPTADTTWRMWSTALWGMRTAARDKAMFFEWTFGLAHRRKTVGFGFLGEVASSSIAVDNH